MSIRGTMSLRVSIAILAVAGSHGASAAQGEMGTGIPTYGIYSEATGDRVAVWSLSAPTVAFPSGCTSLNLTPTTMGWETYKIAVATLMMAKATQTKVRFYAHAPRDGGCGVDYVQLVD